MSGRLLPVQRLYKRDLSISEDLLKKLNRKYDISSTLQFRHHGNDVSIQTDEQGNAVRMFIGRLNGNGRITGDRFLRTIIKDRNGLIIKDYWERKGKAS